MVTTGRRNDLFELVALDLPRDPRVVDIWAEPYVGTGGREALRVWVIVESLRPEQETDFSWTVPIHQALRRRLEELGDDRFPTIFVRLKSEVEPGGTGS